MDLASNLGTLDSAIGIIASLLTIVDAVLGIYMSLLNNSSHSSPTAYRFALPAPAQTFGGASQQSERDQLVLLLDEAQRSHSYVPLKHVSNAFGVIAIIFFILLCGYFVTHPISHTYYYNYLPYEVYNNNWIWDAALLILAVVSGFLATHCEHLAERELLSFVRWQTGGRYASLKELQGEIEAMRVNDPTRQNKSFLNIGNIGGIGLGILALFVLLSLCQGV